MTNTLHDLGSLIHQAQALAAVLSRTDITGLEPETVQDFATALGEVLQRAQDKCTAMHDAVHIPVQTAHRLRAACAELEAAT